MYLAIILTIGKYLFLVLIYLFAFLVFRGMLRELTRAEGSVQAARPAVRPGRQVADLRSAPAQPPTLQPPPGEPQPAPRPTRPRRPAPTPAPPRPRLLVIKAGEGADALSAEIELSAAVTIGRADDNFITLHDRYVSGHHAQVHLREGGRYLLDRGSTNGTLLNGRPVQGEVPINDRDQITIGTTIFEYRAS